MSGSIQLQDLVLVVDVSSSMLSQDFDPNRLEYLKNTLTGLIKNKPECLRIGLVAFAGQTQTICPLSSDEEALIAAVNKLNIGMLEDGTAIGNGIGFSYQFIKQQ